MGDKSNVIDFVEYKERKQIKAIGFYSDVDKESKCPTCQAPTFLKRTGDGQDSHAYNGVDMAAYYRLKALLASIVSYFKEKDKGVSDVDLVEVFGEAMKDFLKELAEGK